MGLLGFGSKKKTEAGAHGFDTWGDPVVASATSDWQRRLDGFAKKSARALLQGDVQLFRSAWARGGNGTYRDAFWLVAADVARASRSWVKFQPLGEKRVGPSYPPPVEKREYVGHVRGSALLLTKSGILCGADFEGFLTPIGGVDDKCMDMIFTNVRRDDLVLGGRDGWGWYNQGRWRSDPRSDLRVYGVDAHVHSIRFEERYRCNKVSDPGYGTSVALSRYVKSKGSTQWPRHFISFDY
jgi:hypothetical protein